MEQPNPALYFEQKEQNGLTCTLCPICCDLLPGETGICACRTNEGGILVAKNMGWVRALSLEPMERVGFTDFYPEKKVLRVGSYGCPVHCAYCETPSLQQPLGSGRQATSREIHDLGVALVPQGNCGVAYSYGEPLMWYEFLVKTAALVKKAGLANLMVTNGYVNAAPLSSLLQLMDAYLIDLGIPGKNEAQWYCKKNTVRRVFESGRHLELRVWFDPTDPLAVDHIASIAADIATTWSELIPCHISFPMQQRKDKVSFLPTLEKAKEKAQEFLQQVTIERETSLKIQHKTSLVKHLV